MGTTEKTQRLERIDNIVSSFVDDEDLDVFDESRKKRDQKKYEQLLNTVLEHVEEIMPEVDEKDVGTILITLILKEQNRISKTIH